MKAIMYNHNGWVDQTDEMYLRDTFTRILKDSGFHIEEEIHRSFKPFGYTGLWLLSESHFAIHTFPEEGKSYVEMSSCIKEPFKEYKKAIKKHDLITIKRI